MNNEGGDKKVVEKLHSSSQLGWLKTKITTTIFEYYYRSF
jgi:hypothetical protein